MWEYRVIDIPRTKEWLKDKPDGKINPNAVSFLLYYCVAMEVGNRSRGEGMEKKLLLIFWGADRGCILASSYPASDDVYLGDRYPAVY